MRKLSLISKIEGIITPLIDPNIMPHTSLDKISSVRRTREIPIHRVGGACTGPMGYVVMKVQIEGVPSYGEDQVFLVVDDNSAYSRRVPVILGPPTINHIIMVMRELEMSTALPEWQYSHHNYELANGFFMGMVGTEAKGGAVGFATNTAVNPVNLDERIKLKEQFIVPTFGMLVLQG